VDQTHALRPLLLPCALVGLYVVLVTLFKDAASIWPLDPGSTNWRFGALGFFLGTGSLPVLGLAMLALVAGLGDHRRLGMLAAAIGFALGVVVLVGLVVFVVDAQTLLAESGDGDAGAMIRGAVRRTAAMSVLAGPAYLAVGVGAWRSARATISPDSGARPGLVVGGQAR
jgi:hypothetical protein